MDRAEVRATELVAGRYELERELARGGMGVVYRALDRSTGATVALKRSLEEREEASQTNRSLLRREYQTLITLRHPRIIQVYDFGVDEVGPYYTMELLDGVDLRSKCPLPWREACSHLRDIASSLALLHSRRLIHCDVSVANVRLTQEGRAKLLDFGTLASFGRNAMIAGTPPMMAPEVLAHQELDQRVDLYALGATAYYALTGEHAYPVSMVALLPPAWAAGRPAPPSKYAPDVPRELDELVLSLLDLDRMSRPASAAEVIDRLGAIAELAPDEDQRVQRSYLHAAEVAGRDNERALLEEKLKHALSGRGSGVLIEGASGMGKTFLLEDIARQARMTGARVITVNARAHSGPYSTWAALLREANLTGALGNLPIPASIGSDTVLLRLTETRPLLVAIEELHSADADSLTAVAALARAVRHKPILLLATLDPARLKTPPPAFQLLCTRTTRLELRPLDEKATHKLVTGLFGEVSSVQRLSAFLFRQTGGNPGISTEILQYLIAQEYVRYAEGTWILPDELPEVGPGGLDLSTMVDAAFEARIESWDPALRALATSICPHRRTFDLELCRLFVEGEPELAGKDLEPLLDALVREDVVVADHGEYVVVRSRIRDVLYARIPPEEKKLRHGKMGAAIAKYARGDLKRGFEIGFHLLLAGQVRKARAVINDSVQASLTQQDLLVDSVPDLWALLEQQRKSGATDEDVQFMEGLLILSGYYNDPTVQEHFAGRVLPIMHRTLGFALATRLSPYIGRVLGLIVGLTVGWFRMRTRTPYLVSGRTFMTSILIFISVCASLSGGACFRLDRNMHAQLIDLLQVAGGLDRLDPMRLLYDLFHVAQHVVKGQHREALAGLEDQLARLPKVRGLTVDARSQYESGLHFFVGRNHLQRIDSVTLQSAEHIDKLGAKNDRLLTHFLRRTYHLYRGDLVSAKSEEERFDETAATFGSRWLADMVAVLEFLPYHLAGDVLALKRTLSRIERLEAIAPRLSGYREIIRAMYEGHRGRPDLALKIYEQMGEELDPFRVPVWASARAHQAECLNALGRPSEALNVCEHARAQLTPADRIYVHAYLQLERESAIALAALGRSDEAVQQIDALIAEYEPYGNPLVTGLLHFDRGRIACTMRDREAFERHSELTVNAFSQLGNPALLARAKRLTDFGRTAGLVEVLPSFQDEEEAAQSGVLPNSRAQRVIEEVVHASGAEWARLYLVLHGRAVLGAQHGEGERISRRELEREIKEIATALRSGASEQDISVMLRAARSGSGATRRHIPLVTKYDPDDHPELVAMLVLGGNTRAFDLGRLELAELASELVSRDVSTEVV